MSGSPTIVNGKVPVTQSAADTTRVITGAFAHGFVTPGKTLDRYVELNTAWTQTSAPIWTGQATAAEGLRQVQQKFLSLIHTT